MCRMQSVAAARPSRGSPTCLSQHHATGSICLRSPCQAKGSQGCRELQPQLLPANLESLASSVLATGHVMQERDWLSLLQTQPAEQDADPAQKVHGLRHGEMKGHTYTHRSGGKWAPRPTTPYRLANRVVLGCTSLTQCTAPP